MTAYLTVLKDTQMILMFESSGLSQTDQLARILPRDEVITETFFDKKEYKVACRTRRVQSAYEEILPPCVSWLK